MSAGLPDMRRAVSFSRAVYEGEAKVEDATGILVHNIEEALKVTEAGNIAVIVDEHADIRKEYRPDVLVDGIMAKKNVGTGGGGDRTGIRGRRRLSLCDRDAERFDTWACDP